MFAPLIVHHEQTCALSQEGFLRAGHFHVLKRQSLPQQCQRESPVFELKHATMDLNIPPIAIFELPGARRIEKHLFVAPEVRGLRLPSQSHEGCGASDQLKQESAHAVSAFLTGKRFRTSSQMVLAASGLPRPPPRQGPAGGRQGRQDRRPAWLLSCPLSLRLGIRSSARLISRAPQLAPGR